MDLTEAEDIKKGWQEYTEELYKKDLHYPDNHDGVIIHLEPDILECEVKWALGSILEGPQQHCHKTRRTLMSPQECKIARCTQNQIEMRPISPAPAP